MAVLLMAKVWLAFKLVKSLLLLGAPIEII
jgi:hypothetical protein